MPESTTPQSIAAVLGGFFASALLTYVAGPLLSAAWPAALPSSGPATDRGALLVLLAVSGVAGTAGGYAAARWAPKRPLAHALALGGLHAALLLAVPILGLAGGTDLTTLWYHAADLALALPCAWLGGALAARRHASLDA